MKATKVKDMLKAYAGWCLCAYEHASEWSKEEAKRRVSVLWHKRICCRRIIGLKVTPGEARI